MKKLFAIFALVAFFGAIASPAIAASFSAPIVVKVIGDKPKKAKATTQAAKADCSAKKADCKETKGSCCQAKKECSGTKAEVK